MTEPKRKTYRVSWFSTGVSSAVATKLLCPDVDEIIYTHIEDQHHDTIRFIKDCEAWFSKPVTWLQSELGSVASAIFKARYVNGPGGAACTRMLKRQVRQKWEQDNIEKYPLEYV